MNLAEEWMGCKSGHYAEDWQDPITKEVAMMGNMDIYNG